MRSRALLPVFIMACTSVPASDGWTVQRVDSAGVAIVTNVGHANAVPSPTYGTTVALTIGVTDGPAEYTFGRIGDVEVDATGRFLVLDQIAQAVVVFSPAGEFLFRLGGPGEGPGEMGDHVLNVRAAGDTVYVVDTGLMRLNTFPLSGGEGRTERIDGITPGPVRVDRRLDGRLLVRWLSYHPGDDGRFEALDALLISSATETRFDTLMRFTYPPPDFGSLPELQIPLIPNGAFYDVLRDGRVAWSHVEGEEIAVHGADGVLRRIVRSTDWVRSRLSAEQRAMLEQAYRAKIDRPRGPLPPSIVFPDRVPTITAVRAAPGGGFWVQRMSSVSEMDPMALAVPALTDWLGGPLWEVFDADGTFEGVVRLPDRFRVTRIVEGAVVGVSRDESDVERVVVLSLVEPPE